MTGCGFCGSGIGGGPISIQEIPLRKLTVRADRCRAFLGHVTSVMPANPLAPKGSYRRYPKMLPDGARERLLQAVNTARDRLVITWLADGGSGSGNCVGCTWSTCTCATTREDDMHPAADVLVGPSGP